MIGDIENIFNKYLMKNVDNKIYKFEKNDKTSWSML